MAHSDPSFPSELVAALRSETPALDASAAARIRDRLMVSVAAPPLTSPDPGTAQVAATSAVVAKGSATLLALGFAIGTGVGVAGHALMAPPEVRVVYRDRVVEVKAPPAPTRA